MNSVIEFSTPKMNIFEMRHFWGIFTHCDLKPLQLLLEKMRILQNLQIRSTKLFTLWISVLEGLLRTQNISSCSFLGSLSMKSTFEAAANS